MLRRWPPAFPVLIVPGWDNGAMGSTGGVMVLSGAVLILIELARSVPAWLRVRRTGSADGVSAMSVGILAGTGPGWIAVAVMADSPAAAIATVVWLVFHLMLWHAVSGAAPRTARPIAVAAVLSLVMTGLVALVGYVFGHLQEALGVAIAFASAAYSIPALFSGMTSVTTAGLSIISLSVNSMEGAIYLIAGAGYGGISPAGHIVLGYIFFGGIALLSNVPRLVRTSIRRLAGKDLPRNDRLRTKAP
jgi:hypothetical protein